jgi:chromosome segregation ATPase
MGAGLLMMNNFIGEWVTDIRIQTKTLDTKVNEIGTLIQGLSQEVASAKTANLNLATQLNFFDLYAAGAEKENTKALNEMKEMMGKMMGQMKEMREHEQKNFAALVLQNQRLMHELATFKESKSVVEEEVRLLRAEHEMFKKLVERVSRKVEMAVDYQRGLEEAKDDEEEDWLMWVLWPQGGWKDEGMKKHGVEKELERGVLADKPGFRVPQHELGKGKPGGGWCTVM